MENLNTVEMALTAEKARNLTLNVRMAQKQSIINDILSDAYKEAINGKYDCYCTFYKTIYPEVLEAVETELKALGYTVSKNMIHGGWGIKIKWAE